MYIIYDDFYLKHDCGPSHPENSDRLRFIINAIRNSNFSKELSFESPFEASPEQISLIHEKNYIKRVRSLSEEGGYHYLDIDTVVSENTFKCALLAVGGCFKGIDLILNDVSASSFFAIIRPPGHHAFRSFGSGFCIFNNIALAARYAQTNYNANKIAIIDFDLHHGNGTQDFFYSSNKVFYISFHQYPYYPGTGYYDEIGRGAGEGYNLNFPFPAGSDETDYLFALTDIILPVLKRFKPELILVSAGYDGHFEDPFSSINLKDESFYKIMNLILFIGKINDCNKIGIILEGGYNHEATARGVLKTISACIEGLKEVVNQNSAEYYLKLKQENKINFSNIKKLFKI
jgi:acetoin utilization deacetylase AcuC-like enzyme